VVDETVNERAKCGLSVVTMLREVDEAIQEGVDNPSDIANALERVDGAVESCNLQMKTGNITSPLSGAPVSEEALEQVKANFVGALTEEGLPDM